jgi:hypothetical protein
VTTEQFERGKVIILQHLKNRSDFKRQHYLLLNMLYVQVGERQYKMYDSTPTGRSKNSSYYITHSKPEGKTIRIGTLSIDEKIPLWLAGISVDTDLIPVIRESYKAEIKKATQDEHEKTLAS